MEAQEQHFSPQQAVSAECGNAETVFDISHWSPQLQLCIMQEILNFLGVKEDVLK